MSTSKDCVTHSPCSTLSDKFVSTPSRPVLLSRTTDGRPPEGVPHHPYTVVSDTREKEVDRERESGRTFHSENRDGFRGSGLVRTGGKIYFSTCGLEIETGGTLHPTPPGFSRTGLNDSVPNPVSLLESTGRAKVSTEGVKRVWLKSQHAVVLLK